MSATPTVVFTAHARDRIASRGIADGDIERLVLSPSLSGPAGDGSRWSTGAVIAGGRRAFLTAIHRDEGLTRIVLTCYMGAPSRVRVADSREGAS